MENLQVFNNEEFGQVRVIMKDGEPWFVGKDVAEILGYTDLAHAILDHVDEEDRVNSKTQGHFDLELGQRGGWLIAESGLYSLVLSSKLPKAKKFKRWVIAEVLPSIRKTGMYVTPQAAEQILNDPSFLIKALTELQKTREELTKVNKEMDEARPKVQLANAVLLSDDCILVREMAKILKQYGVDIGEHRFYEWLRSNGYLIKKGQDYNQPTQQYMDAGIFRVFESTYTTQDGTKKIRLTTKITTKGQKYFVNKFRKIKEQYEALDMFRGDEP